MPPSRRLRAGVCAREGVGVGGVGGGVPVSRPAEGGGGCEGRREAMDIERLQEALKGGGNGVAALSPFLLTLPDLLFSPFRAGGSQGRGRAWVGRCAHPVPIPLSPPQGREPCGQLPPDCSGLCVGRRRLGWGRGAGEALTGPLAPVTPSGNWLRSRSPL